jgi:hypothetical protein
MSLYGTSRTLTYLPTVDNGVCGELLRSGYMLHGLQRMRKVWQ